MPPAVSPILRSSFAIWLSASVIDGIGSLVTEREYKVYMWPVRVLSSLVGPQLSEVTDSPTFVAVTGAVGDFAAGTTGDFRSLCAIFYVLLVHIARDIANMHDAGGDFTVLRSAALMRDSAMVFGVLAMLDQAWLVLYIIYAYAFFLGCQNMFYGLQGLVDAIVSKIMKAEESFRDQPAESQETPSDETEGSRRSKKAKNYARRTGDTGMPASLEKYDMSLTSENAELLGTCFLKQCDKQVEFLEMVPCQGCQVAWYCKEKCRKDHFQRVHRNECPEWKLWKGEQKSKRRN